MVIFWYRGINKVKRNPWYRDPGVIL
jgi:hypothetical protein